MCSSAQAHSIYSFRYHKTSGWELKRCEECPNSSSGAQEDDEVLFQIEGPLKSRQPEAPAWYSAFFSLDSDTSIQGQPTLTFKNISFEPSAKYGTNETWDVETSVFSTRRGGYLYFEKCSISKFSLYSNGSTKSSYILSGWNGRVEFVETDIHHNKKEDSNIDTAYSEQTCLFLCDWCDFQRCNVHSNEVEANTLFGGLFAISNSSLVSESFFWNNTGRSSIGSGLVFWLGSDAKISIDTSRFENNTFLSSKRASSGLSVATGTIIGLASQIVQVYIRHSSFVGNTANQGAILALFTSPQVAHFQPPLPLNTTIISIFHSIFERNVATINGEGAVIYFMNSGSSRSTVNSHLESSNVISLSNIIFNDNQAPEIGTAPSEDPTIGRSLTIPSSLIRISHLLGTASFQDITIKQPFKKVETEKEDGLAEIDTENVEVSETMADISNTEVESIHRLHISDTMTLQMSNITFLSCHISSGTGSFFLIESIFETQISDVNAIDTHIRQSSQPGTATQWELFTFQRSYSPTFMSWGEVLWDGLKLSDFQFSNRVGLLTASFIPAFSMQRVFFEGVILHSGLPCFDFSDIEILTVTDSKFELGSAVLSSKVSSLTKSMFHMRNIWLENNWEEDLPVFDIQAQVVQVHNLTALNTLNTVLGILSNDIYIDITSSRFEKIEAVSLEEPPVVLFSAPIGVKSGGGAISISTIDETYDEDQHNVEGREGEEDFFFSGAAKPPPKPTSIAELRISNCTFIENTASFGAAIFIQSPINATVTNSSFFNNLANGGPGGAISMSSMFSKLFVNNSIFEKNEAPGGGAINCGGTASIHGSDFRHNVATARACGGAIQSIVPYLAEGTLELVGNNFSYNRATTYGGAVAHYCSDGKPCLELGFQIRNNHFMHNAAPLGGAIYSNVALFIHNATFIDNVAEEGGACTLFKDYIEGKESIPPNLTATSVLWQGNSATNHGGAIYAIIRTNHGTWAPSLTNVTFYENVAEHGGAFSLGGKNASISLMNASNVVFIENKANYGGVGYLGSSSQEIAFDGCEFKNNTAFTAGGVFFYEISRLPNDS